MSFFQKLLLFSCFMCLCTVVEAQISFKPGIRAGLNFARIGNVSTTHEPRLRSYVGAYGNLRASKLYALQFEINYTRQGAKAIDSDDPEINLNYLGINFTNQFYFKEGIYALISPSFDFEFDSERDQDDPQFIDIPFSGLDLTISAGIGYTSSFGLGIELRFKYGALDRTYFSGSSFDRYFNNSHHTIIQMGATYTFGKPYEAD